VAEPAILTVDDDPAVSPAMAHDVRHQYGPELQIVGLGLDMPRRIVVDGRHGRIGIQSTPGDTARAVRLPLRSG
jgi:hypothetical protein